MIDTKITTPITTPSMTDAPDAQKIFDNLNELDAKIIETHKNANALTASEIACDEISSATDTQTALEVLLSRINDLYSTSSTSGASMIGVEEYQRYDVYVGNNVQFSIKKIVDSLGITRQDVLDNTHNITHTATILERVSDDLSSLTSKVGDIDTALDAIIEIQNALIATESEE